MAFDHPQLLLALLAVPALAAAWLAAERRKPRYAVKFTNLAVLEPLLAEARTPWRRHVAPLLLLLSVAALCVGVARPRVPWSFPVERATVILVVDTSESMQADDLRPSRLAVAQRAVGGFLGHVPKRLRVGLVLFSGDAQLATPPTTDRGRLRQSLFLARPDGGTAIGDALALAVRVGGRAIGEPQPDRRLAAYVQSNAPAKLRRNLVSIVFLSDGAQTAGTLSPFDAAARARQRGFRVYTIALGTPHAILGANSGSGVGIPVPPDPDTLRTIAHTTGGEFFGATSAQKAAAAYAGLGSLLGRRHGSTQVGFAFLAAGALLLLAAGVASAAWSPRFP